VDYSSWRLSLDATFMLHTATYSPESHEKSVRHDGRAGAGEICATNDHLAFRPGMGVVRDDYDVKSRGEVEAMWPTPPTMVDHNALWNTLCFLEPGLQGVAALILDSSSSNIYNEQRQWVRGPGGMRAEFPIDDATKIPEMLEILHIRSINRGFGYCFVTKAGNLEMRSLVDLALQRPAQPDFARVSLGAGLYSARNHTVVEGDVLQWTNVKPLALEERALAEKFKEQCRVQLQAAMDVAAAASRERRVERMVTAGIPRERAVVAAQAAERGVLLPEMVVIFDNPKESVLVRDLMGADGGKYHNRTCYDPMEPDYDGGRVVGKFFCAGGRAATLKSFAHGDTVYKLATDDLTLSVILAGFPVDKAAAMRAIALMEHGCEGSDFVGDVNQLAKALEIWDGRKALKEEVLKLHEVLFPPPPKPIVVSDPNKYELEWNVLAKNAAINASMEILGDINNPKIVMQNSGHVLIVREGKPAFYRDESGKEPPRVLKFHMLKKEGIRQLLEDRIAFFRYTEEDGVVEKSFIPVPLSIGVEIMNAAGLSVPHVIGISEHPIVKPDGSILHTPSYDAETGIYLGGNIPEGAVPQEVSLAAAQEALRWLREEFYAEFPFRDALSRDAALASLLTALERKVLPEAPGLILSANTRGSGKTALAQLQQRTLTGRGVPAMTLPENEEEVVKVIVALGMEGRDFFLFDNVRAGRAVESDIIAAMMTSPDGVVARQLGFNTMSEGSGRAAVVMTGIRVKTKGDMNSRMLYCELDTQAAAGTMLQKSRDLTPWILKHRIQALRHAITIVAGYIAAGAPSVAPKQSRFRDWDRLVRSPLLWAGGMDVEKCFDANCDNDVVLQAKVKLINALFDWQGARRGNIAWSATELMHIETVRDAFYELHPKTNWTPMNLTKSGLTELEGELFGELKLKRVIAEKSKVHSWWVYKN